MLEVEVLECPARGGRGLPFRVLRFRVWGFGFRVWGLGFRVWGLGCRV